MFGHKHSEQIAAARAIALSSAHQSQQLVLRGAEGPDTQGFVLKRGERSVYRINGAGLVEPRRAAGDWHGRSAGISVPVGIDGVRVRIGKSRGHFVPGAEAPTVVDTGIAIFTDVQLMFAGPKVTRTWVWDKLLSANIDSAHSWLALGVSNRQKTSGVSFAGIDPQIVGGWLDVALALHDGKGNELAAEMDATPADPALLGPR